MRLVFSYSSAFGDPFRVLLILLCVFQSSGQRSGGGVIGVIECNFLKPAHNKQDFEYTKEYRCIPGAHHKHTHATLHQSHPTHTTTHLNPGLTLSPHSNLKPQRKRPLVRVNALVYRGSQPCRTNNTQERDYL